MNQIWTAKERVTIKGISGFNFIIRDLEKKETRKSFISLTDLDLLLANDFDKSFRNKFYTTIKTFWRFLNIGIIYLDGLSIGCPDWNPLDPAEYPWD